MKGGVSINDRKKGADLRRRLIDEVNKVLDGNDEAYKKEILLRMCGNLMPRLSEVSGPEGEPLTIHFDPAFNVNTSRQSEESTPEPSEV